MEKHSVRTFDQYIFQTEKNENDNNTAIVIRIQKECPE